MFVAGVPGSWLLRLPGGPDEVPDLGTGGARSQGPGGGQAPWALPGGTGRMVDTPMGVAEMLVEWRLNRSCSWKFHGM